MRKLLLVLSLLLMFGVLANAQSTSVTLHVTDTGGQAWASGSYRITFLPNSQFPGATYTWTGGAFDPTTVYSGALDGSGSATFSIPSNSAINPTGTNYSLSVCPFATSPCFSNTVSFNGTTQTLNFTPTAISINAAPGAVAYTDAEVKAGLGGIYYNTTSQLLRLCIVSSGGLCSSWVNVGGGSGPGGTPRLDQVTDPNVSKTFNLGTTTLSFINGSVDFSALTSAIKLPVIAGCTVASAGQICYDSTLGNWIVFNVAQSVIPTLLSSGTYTTGDILGISNVAGTITLTDLGPVNGTSGSSFLQVTTTNLLIGDTPCWTGTEWVNCTPGVPVTIITGTTYPIDCTTDRGSYLLFTNTAAIAVSLPQASTSGACDANFFTFIRTLHGTLTVTPVTSIIDDGGGAAATLVLSPGYGFTITSDDTNYTARGGPYRESGNPLMSVEGFDVNTLGGYDWQSPNNASPGTVLNKMACDDGTGALQTCAFATAATNNPVGVAVTGIGAAPGTTGNTGICFIGFCKVIFDGTATANHFAQLSTTVNGDLHDTGSTTAPTNGQPYWYVFAGNSGAGTTATIRDLSPSELSAVSIGGGGKSTIQINGVSSQPIVNFTTSGGLTLTPTNSGNVTTVAFTISAAGGITSINTSATGPAVTIAGAGGANVSTSGNTITINGSLGPPSPTWVNRGGTYTVPDSDNGFRDRFTSAGTATLPQTNTIATSPLVALRYTNGGGISSSPFTTSAFSQSASNQLLIAVTRSYGNTPITSVTDTAGDAIVKKCEVLNSGSPASLAIYYAATTAAAGSNTVTVTFGAAPASADIYIEELTGTTYDSISCVAASPTSTVTTPVHFANAIALAVHANNSNFVGAGFTTIAQTNSSRFSYRLLTNSSQVTYSDPADPNISTGVIALSTTAATTFAAGWTFLAEATMATGNEVITPTTSLINGQTGLTLVPNETCNVMSNGVGYDAVCGFTPNVTTNGVIGAAIEIAGRNTTNTGSDIGTTTLITSGGVDAFYQMSGDITCRAAVAGTETLTITYTDTSNTAQTITGSAACTALGGSSIVSIVQAFRAKASTNIQIATSHTGSQPTYDVSVALYQLSTL